MKSSIQSALILFAVLTSTMGAEEVIVYAKVGDTVTLQPHWGTLPNPYLQWHFADSPDPPLAWLNPFGGKDTTKAKPWENKLSLIGNALIISNIQEENFGTFICKITDSSQSATFILIKLNVSASPASLLLPGESLSLTCNLETQRRMRSDIHWLNPRGQKVNSREGALTKRVTSQDSGQWTCVVTSNKKEHKKQIPVKVLDLSPAPSRQYTSTNSPLIIPCSFPSDITWKEIKIRGIQEVQWHYFPKPSVGTISKDRQRLFNLSLEDPLAWKVDQGKGLSPVSDVTNGNLTLTRNRGKEEDRGNYTCSMKFKNGVTLSTTVHVEVLKIIPSPKTELISGQWVNLTCTTGNPLPSGVRLKWIPPEKSSLTISESLPALLTIPEVERGDSGKWRCELWQGNVQLTSAVVTLVIEPRMNAWMLVIICSTAVIILLLLLVAFILCRHRQRKMRHFRHQLCQCKNPKPKGFYRT